MNKLSIVQCQSKWRPEVFYFMLAVDGIAFDRWLSEFTDDESHHSNSIENVSDLALALELNSDYDTEVVWQHLGCLDDGKVSYVPLLVCPDDMDLTCIVIATEQHVAGEQVIWKRFARAAGAIEDQNPDEMQWFVGIPELIFDKDNFKQVFAQLNKEIQERYRYYGANINIPFPSKPPKEDWELIVDSWY